MRKLLAVVVIGLLLQLPGSAQLQSTSPQNGALFTNTAVQVSGAVSSDQNLQFLTEQPGNLNYVGKIAHLAWSGTVTSGASANGTWTIKLKLCTVSGCGSGTAVTLATFGPTGTQIASATSAPWTCEGWWVTAASGATGNGWFWGGCHAETASVTITTDSGSYLVVPTAVTANIDLTGQLFWQGTLADSGASANNVINGRNMLRILEN